MIVYIAKNKINSKKYIGYTTGSLEKRIKGHITKAYNKNQKAYNYYFQTAIRKYTIENFQFEILFFCKNKKECCEKEKEYIKQYNTIAPNGYNLTLGGDGGIQSDITKLKISNSIKDIWKNNPKIFDKMLNMTNEERSNSAKKAWETKKINNYKPIGKSHKNESKEKMSFTKNNKNKIIWFNIYTNQIIEKSITDMSKFTGKSIGLFSNLKQKRIEKTKCGWILYNFK